MTSGDDLAIDALAGFLPLVARDRLAEQLTAAEIDTLTHLAKTGTGPNSLRALASDLAYLEAWARASTAEPLVWPASETTVLRFIAHHLWDEDEREKNPEHGMPETVAEMLRDEGRLRSSGPHAPATVRPACIVGAGSKGLSAIRRFATRCVSPSAPPIGRGRAKAPRRSRATFSTSCSRHADGAGRSICVIARFCCSPLAPEDAAARKSPDSKSTISKSVNRSPLISRRRRARNFPSRRSGCGARKRRRPTRARACSSSGDPWKLCAPGLLSQKSMPVRCFGGSTNGETSAPPRSIRKASTP